MDYILTASFEDEFYFLDQMFEPGSALFETLASFQREMSLSFNDTPWRHFEILQNVCRSCSEVLATYFYTIYQQAAVTRKLFNCKSSDWAEIKTINRIRNISQPSGIIAHPHRSHEITRDYTRQIPGLLANELVIKDEQ